MKKGLFEKRIPTIFALIIVFASVFVTSALIQSGVLTVGRASLDTSPKNIAITNITDTSFTVTFTTSEKVASGVILPDFGNTLLLDDRDKSSKEQKPYYAHHITVPNLKPNTEYQFSIISNAVTVLDEGKQFKVKTGGPISQKPFDQKPLFGKILLPDGSSAGDALIFVQITGGQKISTVTKTNGEYIIPTNSIRSSDLASYLKLENNTEINLQAIFKELKTSLSILYKDAISIPPLTLSQNYNFSQSIQEQNQASSSSLLKVPESPNAKGEIKILAPIDKSSLIDQRPTFRGIAVPFQKVKITIHSNDIVVTVTADANGYWSFRPTAPLAPGDHSVMIESQDSLGIVRRIQQAFTIFFSGTQVAQTATPSATPTQRITPTTVPTAIPTPIPTTVPTIVITIAPTVAPGITITSAPTPIPTPLPTFTPTPTSVVFIPSPTTPPLAVAPTSPPVVQATPPVSGSGTTVLLTFVSVLFILTGASLLFIL